MDCTSARPLLEAYLDNELARPEARELEAHVDGCADCRAALTRLDELRRALREAAPRYSAPDALRERIAAAAAHAATGEREGFARRPRRQSPGFGWRVAAACVLAFGAGALAMREWRPSDASETAAASLTHDLFASHWRALAAASPVDVVSTDRHTVKPWFAGKVAQAPVVQDFAEQGFTLVGGRIDYAGAERVPVLVYRHGQHLVDVFVLPRGGSVQPARQNGYALEPVTLAGQPAAIVTDMDRGELSKFELLLAGLR